MLTQSLIAALLLQSAPAVSPTTGPDMARVTEDMRADVRCSAAFAVTASEQARGLDSAMRWPLLDARGREFFVATGVKLMDGAGLDRAAVKRLMEDEVAELQRQAAVSNDPASVVDAVMAPCLERLDAAVPPLDKPDLVQCTAILRITYNEVYGREGLSPTARDLKTLESVLESRARKQLTEQGKSGNEADRLLIETQERILAEAKARESKGEPSRIDFQHCFDLAAPEERRGHGG